MIIKHQIFEYGIKRMSRRSRNDRSQRRGRVLQYIMHTNYGAREAGKIQIDILNACDN